MLFKYISRQMRDKLAVTLSMICVLQCLFLPFIVMAIPFLDFWWLSDHFLHPFLLVIVIPLTLVTLIPSYKQHKNTLPLWLAAPGLVLLSIGAFIPETTTEKILTVLGASFLASAHLRNIILSRKACPQPPSSVLK